MAKFFGIERIKQSIVHLSAYDSKWVLPPLVFASNMVGLGPEYKDLNRGLGTDAFLKNFFSGELIGLPKKGDGDSLRPLFSDLGRLPNQAGQSSSNTDYLLHQKVKLWGSAYSRNGYREMVQMGFLEKNPGTQSSYRLGSTFLDAFERELPATFRFEELLVWLFAFKEIPDEVSSWVALNRHFESQYLNNQSFPSQYATRFGLTQDPLPWPTDFLTSRPSNIEYQKALLPSQFVEVLSLTNWTEIQDKLLELMRLQYEGLSDEKMRSLCRSIVSGLASTKRIFLLGEPGTGKTKLAELIRLAFESIIESDRLLILSTDITEKTTESTLAGFVGLDGQWIFGSLTAPRGAKQLLNPKSASVDSKIRNQVNLITLDEANRKDIEALLARFQTSLDSSSSDPLNDAHTIALGRSGDHLLSPFSYLVMTGNSPRDDEGRAEQSRPFRRRPALIPVPNPLSTWLGTCTDEDFIIRIDSLWTKLAVDTQASSQVLQNKIKAAISSGGETFLVFRQILKILDKYKLGVSYGLLRKIVILFANEMALGEENPSTALDAALETGFAASLSTGVVIEEKSLRSALLALDPKLNSIFPRFRNMVSEILADVSEFGTVAAHF